MFDTVWFVRFAASPWLVAGAGVCAALVVVLADWRLSLFAFAGQGVLLSLLSTRHQPTGWALLSMLVGGLVAVMWFISARQVRWGERQEPARWWLLRRGRGERWPLLSAPTVLRLLAVILAGLALGQLLNRITLPRLTNDLTVLCMWLWLTGLVAMALSDEPLRAGLGLLMLTSGFKLLWGALDVASVSVGLLHALDLCLGLAVAYMIVAHGAAGRPHLAQQINAESPPIDVHGEQGT